MAAKADDLRWGGQHDASPVGTEQQLRTTYTYRHRRVKMADGTELVIEAGDVFAIPPGHDSWVVGEEPYVSLHLLGAAGYAARHEDA